MKIESFHDIEYRERFEVVKSDSYVTLKGQIVYADEETGKCMISLPEGETREYDFGPGGLKIVPKKGYALRHRS